MTDDATAAAADVRDIIDSVQALHGIALTPAQAGAVLAERRMYARLARGFAGLLRFEGEPGHFGEVLSGRRHGDGKQP